MFHSVGLESHPWAWNEISESVSSFENKLALLKEEGFAGTFWADLYDHMAGNRALPKNSVFLTFDDGYLDNWVYVFPLLRKFDIKATIMVTPEFVEPDGPPRLNLEDVWAGRCEQNDLERAGFLRWSEMRAMEASGLVDVQSHALTHTWYFSGPTILDYHRPHAVTPYPWMFWNARTDRKPHYLTEDQQGFLPWGTPILEHEKSLVVTRFFPHADAISKITEFVSTQGGSDFFNDDSWYRRLKEHVAGLFPDSRLPGRYETETERLERVRHELVSSKEQLERELGKTVDFICWPGGGNDAALHAVAREVGYRGWTLDSSTERDKRNRPGADPEAIRRIGTSNTIMVRGRRCGFGGARQQMLLIRAHQGGVADKLKLRLYKAWALLRHSTGLAHGA